MSWLDIVTGVAKVIREELGDWSWDFAERAAAEPIPAAIKLESSAGRLEALAEARRPRRSGRKPWIARYRLERAKRLRRQAFDLRAYAAGYQCELNPTRTPGT